jgi:hypothetical protein
VNLKKTAEQILCVGVMLIVGLAGTVVEAQTQKKTSQSNAAPAKPAPPPVKAAPARSNPTGGGRPPVGKLPTPPPTGPKGGPGGPTPDRRVANPTAVNGPLKYKPPSPNVTAKQLPGNRTEYHDPTSNRTVTTNSRGEVTHIKAGGLAGTTEISRGPRGERTVVAGRPGARVVSYGAHRGFVERTVRPGYISRTYVGGGRSYAHVFREYSYHGVAYYRYVPSFYYGPRFYAWAVTPWGVPVRYAPWSGFLAPPWFGFYGGYFTPFATYASPDLWLTDYVIGQNLSLAYESQQAGNPDQSAPPEAPAQQQQADPRLSPEMKALIADEVRQQLAAEKAAAADSTPTSSQQPAEQLPPALSQKFFVVSASLEVATAPDKVCSLTPGDIIQRKGKDVVDGGVAVEVESSKSGDCPADSRASVQLADLQEMHNQFREQIDSGLKTLAENQAKGLPTAPASEERPVQEGTALPVPDAETQLVAQETAVANLEAQVRQGSAN